MLFVLLVNVFLFGNAVADFSGGNNQGPIDITDPLLPHAADSVIFDWYHYYAPKNTSNDTLGLYNGSWHSGDERTEQYFPHWIQIDFGSPRIVVQLNILAYSETYDANLRLKNFRFEGSNDGSTYIPLHKDELQYANRHEWQSFFFLNSTGYRYYRLYGLNNCGAYDYTDQMIIEEWEMFERHCDIDDNGAYSFSDLIIFHQDCKEGTATWECDLNGNGAYSIADAIMFHRTCK